MTVDQSVLLVDTQWFEWVKLTVPLAILILIPLYAYRRTGTAYFFLQRVWRLAGGAKQLHDEELNRRWEHIQDIEFLRFQTGIRFQNLAEVQATFLIVDRHAIPLSDLSLARAYYDTSSQQIRESHWKRKAIFMFLVFILYLAIFPGALWVYNNEAALLRVKTGGVYFWSDGETARSFWEDRIYTKGDCQNNVSHPFSKSELAICSSLNANDKVQTLIREAIRDQNIFLLCLATLITIAFFATTNWTGRAKKAHQLREKIARAEAQEESRANRQSDSAEMPTVS